MSNQYTSARNFGEISHQATVVIQCTQDKRDIVERKRISTNSHKDEYYIHNSNATLDNGIVRIDRGDIVFQVGTSIAPRGNILNSAIPVTSNLNGICVRKKNGNKNVMEEKEINLKIAEGIRFIGVSLGATNPIDDFQNTKNQITVRTQGTTTLFNNGDTIFVPGDTIIWKIPTKKEYNNTFNKLKRYGRNPEKITLSLTSVSKFYENYEQSIKNIFTKKEKKDIQKKTNTSVDKFSLDIRKLILHSFYLALKDDQYDATITFDGVWKYFDIDSQHFGKQDNEKDENLKELCNKINTRFNFYENDKDTDLLNENVSLCVKSFLNIQSDLDKRKIGKSLSFSKPGQGIDVLIGAS